MDVASQRILRNRNNAFGFSARLACGQHERQRTPWRSDAVFVMMLCFMGGVAASGAEQKPMQASEPFQYDAKSRRDPFVALVRDGRVTGASKQPVGETLKPVLYGILWDAGGQSIALINDKESRVGDTVNGYRVKEIRQDAVVLEGEGGPIELRITFDFSSSTSSHTAASHNTAKGGARP